MNIVVCDSLKSELQYIYNNISRIFAEKAEDAMIFCFSDARSLSEYLLVSPDIPDAAVISIDLPDSDGISFAASLAKQYKQMKIALVGKDPGNVELLFQIGVVYFLYSPIIDRSFGNFASRLTGLLFSENEKYLNLTTKKGMSNISFSDIFYIMSDKRKIIIYQPNGRTDEVYMKLDEAEAALDSRFNRCHQSYLVNMDYIHGITNEGFTLIDNNFIPISQKKYWSAKKQYVGYIKSRG